MQRMHFSALLLLCSFFCVYNVEAHGWLVSPRPRGVLNAAGASKAMPCGRDGTSVDGAVINPNEPLIVYWDIGVDHNGNGQGSETVDLSISFEGHANPTQSTSLATGIPQKSTDCNGMPTNQSFPFCTSLDLSGVNVPQPSGESETTPATLIWKWTPGDNSPWYSCAYVEVRAAGSHVNRVQGTDLCFGGLVYCRDKDNAAARLSGGGGGALLAALVASVIVLLQ